MKALLSTFVALWPAGRVKNALLNRLGHKVDRTASIAPILVLGGSKLQVAPQSRIGPLSAFRSVRVVLETASEIGQLNWISAAAFLVKPSESRIRGMFILGEHASLTNRHYIDASGGVRIGRFATVAGVRSVFFTHGIDVSLNGLVTGPIEIGEYAMVGSSVNVALGSTVPGYSVVGMGSTVVPGMTESGMLYVGTPARAKKPVDVSAPYFRRTIGAVPAHPARKSPGNDER